MEEAKKPIKLKTHHKKFKLEQVKPSDIVDVWQLYKQSLDKAPEPYPDMSEEPEKYIRSQVFNMISAPSFLGVIAKVGRRPVGQLNGFVVHRPFGSPKVYLQFWMFWVDPDFRKSDIATQMFKAVGKRAKDAGVFNFESVITPDLIPAFEKVYGGQLKVVSHTIIGKVKAD